MKKLKIASIMLCAVLAAQLNPMIANADHVPYSKGQYEAAQTGTVDHDQKRTILESKGMISAELAKDETKPVTYADAANACVVMIMRSEAQAQKLSEKDRLDVLISAGIIDENAKDVDMSAGITVGEYDEFSGTYAPVYVINNGSNGHELLTMKIKLENKQA